MAERGAAPAVPLAGRRALSLLRSFTHPLLPDDYLELINPLWSTRELRGRVERVERHTADAATVVIKPGWEWPGHRPGQYVRLGVEVDGVHHWRAYSLTSDPQRRDGRIAVTPKLVEARQAYCARCASAGNATAQARACTPSTSSPTRSWEPASTARVARSASAGARCPRTATARSRSSSPASAPGRRWRTAVAWGSATA